jgi:pimeloyl-ACP methyl ester carboxylesterase
VAKTFMLLHGSWHTGSCWNQVKQCLEEQGHHVHAPTLYGHGLEEPPADTSIELIAKGVADYLEQHDLHGVVLVGWSFGGIIAQRVYERATARVAQVVFFDAYLLHSTSDIDDEGANLIDPLAARSPEATAAFLALEQNGVIRLPFEMFAGMFMTDGNPELQQRVFDSLHPEPVGPVKERCTFDYFWSCVNADPYQPMGFMHLPTAYIVAKQDLALGPGFWEELRVLLGPSCRHVDLLAGGHEACYTQPIELAHAILEAVAAYKETFTDDLVEIQ